MNEVIETNFRTGMVMRIYGFVVSMIYRMGMGKYNAVGTDM